MFRFSAVMVTALFGSLAFAANNAPEDGYYLSGLRAKFDKVLTTETVTKRTVAFKVSACVRNRGGGPAVINRFAALKDGLGLNVDGDGRCFTWDDKIDHSYYSPEHYFEIQYEVLVNNQWLKQSLFVNPWTDKFTFAVDPRDIPNAPSILAMKGGDASLVVTDLSLVKTQKIDSNILATVLLEAHAKMNDMLGRPIDQWARDGQYQLSVDVLQSNDQISSSSNYSVNVVNGTILAELSIPQDSPKDTKVRLTLQPIQARGENAVQSTPVILLLSNEKK